ncbi:hypothetical protein [Nocardia sp. NPDC050717]|uniref:hypothetical protein n=1 Tax=Nocardia sp. NPDC050717 TaxID=3157221 RepID=UPI003401ADA9
MGAQTDTITAKIHGNPLGIDNNPWPDGHPVEGERVAIFAFDVRSVDGSAADLRTYHLTPVDRAGEGPVTAPQVTPQGTTTQWTACGTGTVVRAPDELGVEESQMDPVAAAEKMFQCQVRPDAPLPSPQ